MFPKTLRKSYFFGTGHITINGGRSQRSMRMRFGPKAAVAVGVTLASGLGALAADLPPAPAYKAAPIAAVYDWTGFYVGGNLGYGWARASGTATVGGVPTTASENLNGVLGGVQAGFIRAAWSPLRCRRAKTYAGH